MKLLHLLLAVGVTGFAPGAEVEDQGIASIIRKHFPDGSKGGLALLVIRDKEVIHCQGYGLQFGKTPISPQTRMPLASVSKQFAAMCAALLIEEGKLNMTDKVSQYIPDIPLKNQSRDLLIQDLLWHISGLPNFIQAEEKASITQFKIKHGLERLNNETHAKWLSTMPLRRSPGVEFEYTNSGYVLLARIIELVAGKPFSEFQQERIFDVLGMKDTRDSTRFNGSGNMGTTLEDYARWDRALWDGTLLNNETSKLLFQSGKLDNGAPVGYGFGWHVEDDEQGLKEVWHGGAGSPKRNARNMIIRDIRNRITVVLLVRENLTYTRAVRKSVAVEVRDYVRDVRM